MNREEINQINAWYHLGKLFGKNIKDLDLVLKKYDLYDGTNTNHSVSWGDKNFIKLTLELDKLGVDTSDVKLMHLEWSKYDIGNGFDKYCFYWGYTSAQDETKEWITFSEASQLYGLSDSTLRKAVEQGRFNKNEVRKSGKIWLVTKQAMKEKYSDKRKEAMKMNEVFEKVKNCETVIELDNEMMELGHDSILDNNSEYDILENGSASYRIDDTDDYINIIFKVSEGKIKVNKVEII